MKKRTNMKNNMKKYSRKLKNKKFKWSRKMLKGGSMVSMRSMSSMSRKQPLSFYIKQNPPINTHLTARTNTNWRSKTKNTDKFCFDL